MPRWVGNASLVSSLRSILIIFSSWLTIIGVAACTRGAHDSVVVQFAIDEAALDAGIEIRDLRFYVHDIELLDAHDAAYPFDLVPDSRWQDGRIALVDLLGTTDEDRHVALRGNGLREAKRFGGIRFTVGVPFESNHVNPLKALPPLNRGDLFWSWQAGYKFLRVDLSGMGADWSFHLGSTGCASASAVRAPQQPCSQPNLMRVELRGFDPLREPIRVRMSEFVDAMRAPGSGTCTGGYAHDAACTHVFATTGLEAQTGSCADGICRSQRIFASPR